MSHRIESDKLALAAGQREEEKNYWMNRLSGELVKSTFPADYQKENLRERRMESKVFEFPSPLARRLIGMTNDSDIRLNIVLITGAAALLARYSGNEDIIVGMPIYRQEAEVEFINTVLPLRYEIGPGVTFKEMILEMGQVILAAAKNQNYPMERLLNHLKISYTPGDDFPLFDVAVILENIHDRGYIRHIHTRTVFSFLKTGGEIKGTLSYDALLYAGTTAGRLVDQFLNLLQHVAFHVDTKVCEIDILSTQEKERLLFDFNDSKAGYPQDKTIVQMFREQVEKTPDTAALVFEQTRLTYKKLHEKSNRLARLLRDKGVKADNPVGIMVERSLEMVMGIWGIIKAGGAYVPVNPQAPGKRLRYVFENADVRILLTQGRYMATFEKPYEMIDLESTASYVGTGEDLEHTNSPGDLAYIIYTSGSTGNPKGVMIRHRSVINIIEWFAGKYRLQPGFNLLQMFEYTFDASVNQVFGSLLHGVTLHIIRKEYFFDIEYLREYITGHNINLINFVQSVIKELLCGKEKLKTLEYVISGAEKLKSAVKKDILDNGYALYNQYGPTEVTVDALAEKCSYDDISTVGTPVNNTRCYIVDKYTRLNPVGVAGELWISGDGLARGYVNNVELTANKFSRNPFFPGRPGDRGDYERVYKSGDLTRWLETGRVEFLGRIDNQVKIRGFRIEPVEIANQLVKIQGIKEAVVIDREDDTGDTYLCAYLVGEEGETREAGEIKKQLARTLPDYMIPSYYVWIEALPLSGHGKLIRSALPEPGPAVSSGGGYTAPTDETERKMVEIWSEVLNIQPQDIGIDADFFEMGGHSLKAVILMSKIHKELDVKVPLAEVFRTPTVKGLAAYVKKAAKDIYFTLEAVEKKEYYPLSSAQKRIYIIDGMDPQSTAYNMRRVIPLGGSPGKQRLENVLRALIHRHDSLRTSFRMIRQIPVQVVHDNLEFQVEYDELGEKTLARGINEFARPFDLTTAPLVRARVVKTGEGLYYLLVDMHHIISDGTSREILDRDFSALNRGETLPPLKLQYKDFSQWQNREQGTERLKRKEKYWLKALAGEIPVLDLPVDYPRPLVKSFEGGSTGIELNPGIARALTETARNRGVTLYMMLLAVANILFAKLSGQEEIVLGTPVAGRDHADLEGIIGMFVNTLVLRNSPAGTRTFGEFLGEIKEKVLEAFENQEYPFEELVEKLSVKRDMGRNPLFDVMLLLQNFYMLPAAGKKNKAPADPGSRGAAETAIAYDDIIPVAKFDLVLTAEETPTGLSLSIQYCTKLFKKETIERFIVYLKKIISTVIKEPGIRISEIEIIPGEEKKRILFDMNKTRTGNPEDKTIHRLFEEQEERTPGNIALHGSMLAWKQGKEEERKLRSEEHKKEEESFGRINAIGDQAAPGERAALPVQPVQLTYRELNEKSDRLANALIEKGVQPETIVGIKVERSVEMVVGILGILKAGGAYMPVEPGYPPERIEYMLKDSGTTILMTAPIIEEVLNRSDRSNMSYMSDQSHQSHQSDLSNQSNQSNQSGKATTMAYIIYTSGTTGRPKGTIIGHRNVVRLMKNDKLPFDFDHRDNWTMFHSYCFDFSVWEMYGALLKGGKLVVISKMITRDMGSYLDILKKMCVTVINQTPSAFYILSGLELKSPGSELSTRYVIFGGEALKPSYLQNWKSKYPGTKLINMYGITETTVHVTLKELEDSDIESNTGNIGKPIPTLTAYVMDKNLRMQPVGVAGELCVGGEGVARGYLNRPGLTGEKFVENPYQAGERLYKSGDLVKSDATGDLHYLGRIDHQVKIRGYRIELGEIESRLVKMSGIKKAVAVAIEQDKADKHICAYWESDKEYDISELREHLSKELPDYMIPTYFVRVEKIPLTPNGKIDREALPQPGTYRSKREQEYVAPAEELEIKIASIWNELLQLEKVGIYDDFFESGGNSLKIIQLKTRLTEELKKNIPVVVLFQHTTISSFVEYLKTSEEKNAAIGQRFDRSEQFDKAKITQKNIREKRKKRGQND